MAQEKNPVLKESWYAKAKREAEEFDRDHPILDTRYYIQEWRKAYTPWYDPYDDEVPAKMVQSWGPFTRAEYDAFLEKYEPTKKDGYSEYEFVTKVEHLRHYSYNKWGR